MIPVGDPLANPLTTLFAVDVLVPVCAAADLLDVAKSFPDLYWPEAHQQILLPGSDSPNFIDVRKPIELLRNEREIRRKISRAAFVLNLEISHPLYDVLLATFGGYPDSGMIGLDYSSMFRAALMSDIRANVVFDEDIATAITPSDIAS